jgi:formylglycine-generating enzyme required for sulfatase activity
MSNGRTILFCALCAELIIGCRQRSEAAPVAQVPAPAPPSALTGSGKPSPPEGMVYVPGGSFDMGPPREVTLGKAPQRVQVAPFFIDRTEVTVAAYLACVRDKACTTSPPRAGCNATAKKPLLDYPMNCITKTQTEQYCAARGKRLPSAAEWEFAARGTDGRVYPWGNADAGEQLCWQGREGAASEKTCAVGSFPAGASPFGVLDMAGNVAEWTSTPETETAGPGGFRTRGGGYPIEPIDLSSPETLMIRADQWETFSAEDAEPRLGVRCAKDGG